MGGACLALPAAAVPSPRALATTCVLEALCVAPICPRRPLAFLALAVRPLGLRLRGPCRRLDVVRGGRAPGGVRGRRPVPALDRAPRPRRACVGDDVGRTYRGNTSAPSWARWPAVSGSAALPRPALAARRGPAPGVRPRRAVQPLATARLLLHLPPPWRRAPLLSKGPTAAWRHSGIGAGRVSSAAPTWGPSAGRRRIAGSDDVGGTEGVESSIAIQGSAASRSPNGKVDGTAAATRPTGHVGLLGAILHEAPRRCWCGARHGKHGRVARHRPGRRARGRGRARAGGVERLDGARA